VDDAESVPRVALCALPFTWKGSAPGDDVGPSDGVDASDGDGTPDPLAFNERDGSADFDTLGDPLEDADNVPPVPLTYAPAEPVGAADGVALLVDVAVDDAVPLLVGV